MKQKLPFTILLIMATLLAVPSAYSDIERGTEPGEIYISSGWYYSYAENVLYSGLFYSPDNGEHLEVKYKLGDNSANPDTIQALKDLIADAAPGVIYSNELYPSYYLWVSHNDGENWQFSDAPGGNGQYTSGCVSGEVYRTRTNEELWRRELHRSINFGSFFQLVHDSISGVPEVGINPGEIYLVSHDEETLSVQYSTDFGAFFTQQCALDSMSTIPQYYSILSRGTELGELYLITWGWDSGYRCYIYRSINFGESFNLQYESEPIDISYWGVSYTAGKEHGSFYIMLANHDEDLTGTYIKILYSYDYAQTFTEYFHHLTEEYPTAITDNPIPNIPTDPNSLYNYPNPFNPNTTIAFTIPQDGGHLQDGIHLMLNIYDVFGNLVKILINEPMESGYHTITWDGTDDNNNPLPSGIYVYQLQRNNQVLQSNKMLLLK